MPRLARLRRIAGRTLPVATKDQVRATRERAREKEASRQQREQRRLSSEVERLRAEHERLRTENARWAEAYEAAVAAVERRHPRQPRRSAPQRLPASLAQLPPERHDPPVVDWIARGAPLESALARAARVSFADQGTAAAQALVDSLLHTAPDLPAARVAAGVVAHLRGLHPLALHRFEGVEEDVLLAAAPVELIGSLFHQDPVRGVERSRAWLAEGDHRLGARDWFEVLRRLVVAGERELAVRAHDRMVSTHAAEAPGEWPVGDVEIAWLERYRGWHRDRGAEAAPGRVRFAVMDYVQPGRGKTSQNIGDHIQTLASLGHLVRHRNVRFHGEDPELVSFVQETAARVRPELALDSAEADVELHRVERDGSTFQAFPEQTWLLEFGWHMHDLLGTGVWDFPLHPNLKPLFVSFHCNKRGLLTPAALDYLRAHGPIGCRDWTTVDLLLSLDVPAFFSGCLTTTVSTVFPELTEAELAERPAGATVWVDHVRGGVPRGHQNLRQSYRGVKNRTFVENMREAVRLLDWYRHDFTDVVTMRLHCYLPATSLGLQVDFQPKNNADVRFNGLFRLAPQQFEQIRTGMLERLRPVLEAVLQARPEAEVYAVWRETVADEVQLARDRHHGARELAALDVTPGRAVTSAVQTMQTSGHPVAVEEQVLDVALTPSPTELEHLPTVLAATAASSSLPVRFTVVAPGARPQDLVAPPGSVLRWVDASRVQTPAGVPGGRAVHRVMLPELLADLTRVVLLPVDSRVLGDLAELGALDLRGHALAARTSSQAGTSGFALFYGAARALDDAPEAAHDFYRRIHARHVFDFDAFDTGVMVLDLARLRQDGFAEEMLQHIREFRIDDRVAFHLYAGPSRRELPAEWAHVPTREPMEQPRLVHWADPTKPWSARFVARQELWAGA